jgi:DnaJ-class molecular chaperone
MSDEMKTATDVVRHMRESLGTRAPCPECVGFGVRGVETADAPDGWELDNCDRCDGDGKLNVKTATDVEVAVMFRNACESTAKDAAAEVERLQGMMADAVREHHGKDVLFPTPFLAAAQGAQRGDG